MLHLKKWGGMLGVFALIAVASAASYQFLNSGNKRPIDAVDASRPGTNVVQANGEGGNNFNRPHYEYSEAFNEGNGYVSNKGGKIGIADNGGTFIVIFKEEALATYSGSKSSLPMPSKRLSLTGKMRLDVKSADARNYVGYLQMKQGSLEEKMASVIGRSFSVRRRMQHAVNGEIVDVTREEAALLEKMPEVLMIEPYREYELDTDTGPQLIGAGAVWDGTNPGAPAQYRGENIVIGVLDSGINFGSPSFAGVGPVDGYVHVNPLGAGNYLGTC